MTFRDIENQRATCMRSGAPSPQLNAQMRIALRFLIISYLLCGVLALMLIPAARQGWFGMSGDGLAAVWAIVLAMPWSIALRFLSPMPVWLSWSGLALGVAINGGLLLWVAAALKSRRARKHA